MSVESAVASYQDAFEARVLSLVREARDRSASLGSRLSSSGLTDDVADLATFNTLAVLTKDELPAVQKAAPPLGGLWAEDADLVRLFASPGPIYEAQLAGSDPWGWVPALEACGIAAGDVVLNCFSYHLSPAGAMFDEACRAMGVAVVPGGVGMADVQAQAVAALGVTAYIGLPSYLAALIEKYDAAGLAADDWRITKALVTAEPLPDPLRESLRSRVDTVLMAYGTAEAGLLGFETEAGGGLALSERAFVQVCDPESGAPVDGEEPGEVVVSVLHRDYPLVRFGTGDVSRWRLGPDGSLRLAGVLGRVGAAVKVRGLFVHPHQAAEVVGSLRPEGVSAGRFMVDRDGDRDVLRLELVAAAGSDTDQLVATATERSRDALRVRPEVTLVDSLADESVLVDARDWS